MRRLEGRALPFKRISSAGDRSAHDSAVHLTPDSTRRRLTQTGARVLNWRPTGLRARPIATPTNADSDDRGDPTTFVAPPASNPQLPQRSARIHAGASDADDVNIAQRAKHAASPKKLPEQSSMYRTPMPIRIAQLTADAVILTLASPFFAVWWLVRKGRQWIGRQ